MSWYTVRPLQDKTWLRRPGDRIDSRFGPASGQSRESWWGRTMRSLQRELEFLKAEHVVMGVDVEERMLRNDGMLRADARPLSPAVELAFDSRHGPLLYRADLFTGTAPAYQHNLRGIVLTLENQRANARYGATAGDQAYAGWKQIAAAPATLTWSGAWDVLRRLAGDDSGIIGSPENQRAIVKRAMRNAHPDRGGTAETWREYMAAAKAVGW